MTVMSLGDTGKRKKLSASLISLQQVFSHVAVVIIISYCHYL